MRKVPTDIRAEAHIKTLPKIEEELSGFYGREELKLNACRTEADGAVLEYLDGETLEARLDSLLEQGKLEELEKLLFTYIDKVRRIHTGEMFFKTPEFTGVFGDVSLEEKLSLQWYFQYRSGSGKYSASGLWRIGDRL